MDFGDTHVTPFSSDVSSSERLENGGVEQNRPHFYTLSQMERSGGVVIQAISAR